jgi:hypothetical protein
MTPFFDMDWRQIVSRIGDPAALESSARACGALLRTRKVRDAATLLRLALMWGPGGHSLRATSALAEAIGEVEFSDVALLKRLRRLGGWLEALCGDMLARRVSSRQAGAQGRSIRLVDGTRIPGPGTSAWRLHLCYNLSQGRLDDLQLTDLSGGERLERLAFQAGEIRIGDRVFAKPGGLAKARAEGADVIVRCTWNSLHLRLPDGRPFAWAPVFSAARADGLLELDVLVDKPRPERGWEPQPMRLIILRKPPAAAIRSRAKARRDSRRDQHRLDPRTLAAADFLIVVTSLPAADYPASVVLDLYRQRWQIEIAIKRLKSLLHLDQLAAKDPRLVRTWLYAHLLLALSIETVEDELDESFP